jgi:hypothetical protein
VGKEGNFYAGIGKGNISLNCLFSVAPLCPPNEIKMCTCGGGGSLESYCSEPPTSK